MNITFTNLKTLLLTLKTPVLATIDASIKHGDNEPFVLSLRMNRDALLAKVLDIFRKFSTTSSKELISIFMQKLEDFGLLQIGIILSNELLIGCLGQDFVCQPIWWEQIPFND